MCTPICPCFSVPKWMKDGNGNKEYRIDAESRYNNLDEELLNLHHRTN